MFDKFILFPYGAHDYVQVCLLMSACMCSQMQYLQTSSGFWDEEFIVSEIQS